MTLFGQNDQMTPVQTEADQAETDRAEATPSETPAERKRKRLLEAAAHCFARVGFAKTTVEEIAQVAGVSKGLLYVHFSSKEALLEAVLSLTLEEWNEAAWSQVHREAEDVRDALRIMHRASIQYALRKPLLRRILDRDAYLLLSTVDAPGKESMDRWGSELTALVERGIESGELRADLDVPRAVDVIRLLHLSYLDRLFDHDEIDASDPELIDAGMGLLLDGLAQP